MSSTRVNRTYSEDVTANMVKILAKQRTGLKICHINAQSLSNKIDEFRYIFENSGLNVICVTETWFGKFITDTLVSLNGYTLYRNDRSDNYGGVAIYVKKGLVCTIKAKSDENLYKNNKIEYLFLDASGGGRKFLIGCVYRPRSNIDFTHFFTVLEDITPLYNDILIAGDFNSNLLVESRLTISMKSFDLVPANIDTPTHFTSSNNTLLDLFFVSNAEKILIYDQLSASCFSRHDLIFMIFDIPLQSSTNIIQFRNFKRINYIILEQEYIKIDWGCIYYMLSVNDQLAFLEQNIKSLYNVIVPIQTKEMSNRQKPWFTSEIKRLIVDRDNAYSRWKRFKTDNLHENYRNARKIVTKTIKNAKSKYYSEKFMNSVSTKNTWKTIREIGIVKNKNKQDDSISDPYELNSNFVNIPMPQADHTHYINFHATNLPSNPFNFEYVSQLDVLKSCISIKSKATGIDSIHPAFLKIILPSLLPFITHIFNKIIMAGTYPLRWKQAKIIPIPKSSTEYRPIAILPYLSKAFEKLLHKQITNYINDSKLLTDQQSGFRAKHSCITALTDVAEDLRKEIDDGCVAYLVLLDHSKAFDTVDHTILIQKLEKMMNFSSTSIRLIDSYLKDRVQCVETSPSTISNFLPVVRGVPQGSILGPLLFSIYANDLPEQLLHCNIRMYADDVQLYISNKKGNLDECTARLNQDLQRVARWADINGLSLNPTKSKCIVIRKRTQKIIDYPNIFIKNQRIEIVDRAKNLGVIFNNTLTWSDHVIAACGKTYSMLRTLWPTQYCTPLKIRLLLAKTYLIPILTYGCEIFASCDETSKSKMNVTYNNIARYVYGIRNYNINGTYISITPYSRKIFGVLFEDLMKIRTLVFLHKIITTREPGHLFNRLKFSRLRRNRNLIQIRHHTLISEWQFFIFAIRLWNNITTPTIKEISNALQFKEELFKYYS